MAPTHCARLKERSDTGVINQVYAIAVLLIPEKCEMAIRSKLNVIGKVCATDIFELLAKDLERLKCALDPDEALEYRTRVSIQ